MKEKQEMLWDGEEVEMNNTASVDSVTGPEHEKVEQTAASGYQPTLLVENFVSLGP